DRKAGHVRQRVSVLGSEKLKAVDHAVVVTRHAGDSPPRDVNRRSLVVRACKESSPKTSHLECCTARSAFRPFHPNTPFALTLRPKCSGCLLPGRPEFYCYFKVLDGQWQASESLGERSAATFSEVLFRQHPAENCMAECSKCLFIVACRSMGVSVSVRRRGASPGRPFRSFRCLGDSEGNGKGGR